MKGLALTTLAACAATAGLAYAQTPERTDAEVIGPENFIISVSDLDRSVAFYRDALGLELKIRPGRGPGLPAPVLLNTALSNLTGTEGAKFRAVRFDLPGSGFGLELAEFTGIERTPAQARTSDPGAAILALTVRDIDAVLSSLQKAGGQVVTIGGNPVHLAGRNGGGRRFVFLRDPDGILIELSQPDSAPSANISPANRIIAAEFAVTVDNTEATLSFYQRVFGLEGRPGESFISNPAVQNGVGAPGARFRISRLLLPGEKPENWGVIESRDVEHKLFRPRMSDPGATAFSLRVRGADALAALVRTEGGAVVSRGDEIGNRPGGIFVRDPNGLLLELVQRTPK